MWREIPIRYGEGTRLVRIPEENLVWVDGPKAVPEVPDLGSAVAEAMRRPIGAPPLAELVRRHGRKTVVLADDNTRSTPQRAVLPPVLDELNAAGVPDSAITVLVALGTHRPMTAGELLERFGEEVLRRVRVENLPQKPEDFADLGTTPLGVPVQVNRRVLESELSVAVGNIIPHMYAGWAGGAKMIQPGVCSALTTTKTHLMAGPLVYEILGNLDNPVRREMEEIGRRSGLKFIVNVVLNAAGRVAAVVAGDPTAAHRAGVQIARPIYSVEVERRAEIVVAGAHPAERDLWQGFKPISGCGLLVEDGGTLILLIPAPEGISPDHPYLVELGTTAREEVLALVERGDLQDGVAAATWLALDSTRRRVHIHLVTDGIRAEEAARIGLAATPGFEEALEAALRRQGRTASIGVITQGADILGRVKPRVSRQIRSA